MSNRVYLTTTLPYVNAEPHIGFALELIQADAVARARRLLGDEVFFNTGTDEHGLKIFRRAEAAGEAPQVFVDRLAERFRALKGVLNVSWDRFTRTTDPSHRAAAQEFWRRCAAAGDIYKKNYLIKYCVGCELEKTESELVAGHCPIHPSQEIEIIEEENYFFRFSKYQNQLLELYKNQADFVIPPSRLNEIRSFVERGLEDFSISRRADKMPWGVPVPASEAGKPGDAEHVMYVWFDALVNYVSAIKWPDEEYKNFWPVIQFAGKDNLRQQAAMWQAMLLSAGVRPSKQIVIHGFITSAGQKMSKSLGNVIDPLEIVEAYSADALRYYLLRHVSPFEDSDFTLEKFREAYNGGLANGLGNLTSRVMKMAENLNEKPKVESKKFKDFPDLVKHLEKYEFNLAMEEIWKHVQKHDEFIQRTEPFKTIKTDPDRARADIAKLVQGQADLAVCLEPFLPATAAKIKAAIEANQKPADPLFARN